MNSTRQPTRHRLTRLGLQFMLIGVFGILGGALNGLNLLIVVAALSLGVLVVQWRTSRGFIDYARIERRMPSEIFAGKPARVRYQVSNRNRLRPFWMLRIVDEMTYALDEKIVIRTAVGLLPPMQITSAFADLTFAKRGRYQLGRWRLETIAPFGLSTAWREGALAHLTVDVYPRLLPLTRSWRKFLPSRIGNVSANAQRRGPSDDVFFGLREYRRGDSPRHIHWRTTARLGEPAVRQFEQQRRYDLGLIVDPYHGNGKSSDETTDAIETVISLAATLAVELVGGTGDTVLTIIQETPISVGGGASSEGLRRILNQLAAAKPHATQGLQESLAMTAQIARRPVDLLVISTRNQVDATGSCVQTVRDLRRWQQHSRVIWLNVCTRDIQRWTTAS